MRQVGYCLICRVNKVFCNFLSEDRVNFGNNFLCVFLHFFFVCIILDEFPDILGLMPKITLKDNSYFLSDKFFYLINLLFPTVFDISVDVAELYLFVFDIFYYKRMKLWIVMWSCKYLVDSD